MGAGSLPERPDLYVVARILERLWREDAPMLKTRLQVAANVNYDVFSRYLSWMLDRGLVALENSPEGHDRVILTPKGYEAYRRLVQWINEVVRGLPPRGLPGPLAESRGRRRGRRGRRARPLPPTDRRRLHGRPEDEHPEPGEGRRQRVDPEEVEAQR